MKLFNGAKIMLFMFVGLMIGFLSTSRASAYSNPAAVPMGTVVNFAALAHTTITSEVGGTVLNNGNLGTDSDCTGFPAPCVSPGTGIINNGTLQIANGIVTIAQTDATAAVTNIGGRSSDASLVTQLGGQTLTSGVYTVAADATSNLTGDLTLTGDASSVFIFHMTSTLVTSTESRVLLTGGVQPCNVFWKVDSSATFNGTTTFVGSVLSQASISFPGGGATVNGRVIAQTGAVTFNNTTVNNSSCAAVATSTSNITSSSSNSSSPAALVCPTLNYETPIIIDSKRVDSDSVTLNWGPYSGTDQFNVRYGLNNGNWLYNVDVTGFSTDINDLPANQAIWVQVAARNNCSIGNYGEARLVGSNGSVAGVSLPNTGNGPKNDLMKTLTVIAVISTIVLFTISLKKKLLS